VANCAQSLCFALPRLSVFKLFIAYHELVDMFGRAHAK